MKKLNHNVSISILIILIVLILFPYGLFQKLSMTSNKDDDIHFFNLKSSSQQINITTPENKIYAAPMSGYYPAIYGFENDKEGSNPNGWNATESASCSGDVVDEVGGHKRVVYLADGNAAGYAQINKTISLTSGIVEFWIRAGETNRQHYFQISDDSHNGLHFYMRNNGYWTYNTGVFHDIETYNVNQWYHVKIEFDTNDFHVWINGVSKDSGSGFALAGSPTSFTTILFNTDYGEVGGNMWIDALGHSWDPEYNIGENLNEGLLLSFKSNITLDWIGYSLDEQVNITILGNTTIPFPNDGLHTIRVFGNNSIGTMYQSEIRYFEIDTSPPVIQINSPDSNQFFGIIALTYEIIITELHLNTTWYSLDNGITNITFSGLIGTINQTLWGNIIDGDVSMIFYANDTWGFESYTAITIRKETVPPISLISYIPYGGMNFVNISTPFTINADDGTGSGVSSIRYKINDSTWIEYTGLFDLSSYPYGEYNITYQSIDNVGNVEDEKSIIVRLVELPSETPGIAGYNVFIVISIFTLIIGVIIKKRSKLKL